MPKPNPFHEFVMGDLLADIPGVTSRAMFGGYGIYQRGLIFALIADDKLYFKVDDSNRTDFEKRGSKPFVYKSAKGKAMAMSYWELPAEVIDDRQEVKRWVDSAVAASKRSKQK